jgi:hypothetical protein
MRIFIKIIIIRLQGGFKIFCHVKNESFKKIFLLLRLYYLYQKIIYKPFCFFKKTNKHFLSTPIMRNVLNEVANNFSISRKMYPEPNEKSSKYPIIGMEGQILGYPEKDELFRKRILRKIKNETQTDT